MYNIIKCNNFDISKLKINDNLEQKYNKSVHIMWYNSNKIYLQTPFLYNCIKLHKIENFYIVFLTFCDESLLYNDTVYNLFRKIDDVIADFIKKKYPEYTYKKIIRNENNCDG